ncbi:prepilin-type N-terminal cleavage/methylation domain-containing protein [Candidatus Peregrinibacteria bacterium]|nr:prepilin-type N-terminal cleavage/methylation domain-containing protein [Candidatus Peregrinibacteria bacterium]
MKTKRHFKNTQRAFTIIEIIVVVMVFSIIIGITGLYSQTSQLRHDVSSQTQMLASSLRLAQSNAGSGKNNEGSGIHFETNAYTLFKGNNFVDGNAENFKIELPSTMRINNVALNGGGNDLIFLPPNGETATFGTLDISSTKIEKTLTITIYPIGNVSYK